MIFRARQHEFVFPRPAVVMGVVNVTPDSFSDGGRFLSTDAAVAHGLELAAQGAEILDVGGESTRPGAAPVSEAEELRRVMPVIEKLAGKAKAILSIDTMKPGVARAALAAGASIINDVAAGHENAAAMWQVAVEFQAGYICMHAQGAPPTMQKNPVYGDVVREVGDFFSNQLKKMVTGGVTLDQVVLDPGIGFGKLLEHNLRLLAGLGNFKALGRPLLLGVSRKSFLEKITGAGVNERLPAALACATLAVANGVQIIRTHDVAETVQALRMTEAVLAQK